MNLEKIHTVPLLAAYMVVLLGHSLEAAEGVHQASGIRFPTNIEGRFLRQEVKESGTTCSTVYANKAGHEILVRVYPAQHGALGPSKLDGDRRSDPSTPFTKELDRLISLQSEGLQEVAVVSRMRFQALLNKGPVGMKSTVRGKVEGRMQHRELLLFERNGFFVGITTRYPAEDWLKTGLTYTDVAHFLGWPAAQKVEPPVNLDKQNKSSNKGRSAGAAGHVAFALTHFQLT